MNYKKFLKKVRPKFEEVLKGFRRELSGIRTSRPSTELVENLKVECFGKEVPLKSLGMIALNKEREIIIEPFDRSYLEPIEKGIQGADLGLSPIVEKERVRVPFPSLTEERRQKFLRLLSGKQEEARQRIRDIRNRARKKIDQAEAEGELREDNKFRAREELQEMLSDFKQKIGDMKKKKEEEIKR